MIAARLSSSSSSGSMELAPRQAPCSRAARPTVQFFLRLVRAARADVAREPTDVVVGSAIAAMLDRDRSASAS